MTPNIQADDQPRSPLSAQPAPSSPSRRRRMVVMVALCVGALLISGGVGAAGVIAGSSSLSTEQRVQQTNTTKIVEGTLEGVTQVKGTLDYADKRSVGGGSGIVTGIAQPGSVVGLGGTLYSLDNIPVLLLRGLLPAWRAFHDGMSDGPDVLQLETSLRALGYFDREPDEEFAASTARAVSRWQKALGLEQTGQLTLGSVVFMPGDVRVASVESPVGASAAASVVSVTSLTKRIDAALKLSDQAVAIAGSAVTVQLPGGTSTTGTITDVGVPTEQESSSGGKDVVIPIGVALDDPATAGSVQRASVTIGIPNERRENVLIVPISALIALDQNRFGVEVVDKRGKHRKVPVTTGLFTSGQVEISGDDVAAGLEVVVPA